MKHVRFTKDQMETICEIAHQDAFDGFRKVWEFILGKPLSEWGGTLNPNDYHIPRSQTLKILRAAESEMNGLWLNNGPGSDEDPEEAAAKVALAR